MGENLQAYTLVIVALILLSSLVNEYLILTTNHTVVVDHPSAIRFVHDNVFIHDHNNTKTDILACAYANGMADGIFNTPMNTSNVLACWK